jgi:hypothetical protein
MLLLLLIPAVAGFNQTTTGCLVCLQAGSHTPLQHIHAEYAEIRGRNEMQQARVEDILSQRLAVEQRTKQVI